MAQELADGEFWLPPEFLNDEDILMDFTYPKPISGAPTINSNKSSPAFYPSDLNSPVESVTGSTETESDEEDYLHGLTRKFSHASVTEDLWKPDTNLKSTKVMAGSPQSTLCGCKHGSSRGSPNCVSPPATAAEGKQNQPSWDLLYAAAGEVARMRLIEEAASRYYNNKNYSAPQPARKAANPNLHYQQLQVAQFQQLKQQQIAKQQYLQMMLQRSRTRNEIGNGRPAAQPLSAWPTPQQAQQPPPPSRQAGSGMRAVFLGNPTSKRESTGTGVFLPRQPAAPAEPFKKRGCSTVLLPDRVVQALDLKLEAVGGESKPQSRCNDAEIIYRKSVMLAQQRLINNRQKPVGINEVRLPQEWTY